MNKKQWCIKHGRMVSVVMGPDYSPSKPVFSDYACHFGEDVEESDWPCYGPLTSCEPPQDRPINYNSFDEPAPDELAVMDENALSLLADFELEK